MPGTFGIDPDRARHHAMGASIHRVRRARFHDAIWFWGSLVGGVLWGLFLLALCLWPLDWAINWWSK